MFKNESTKETVPGAAPGGDSQLFDSRGIAQIAPAVALLLLGNSPAAAGGVDDVTVPEPSILALFAAGAAAWGNSMPSSSSRVSIRPAIDASTGGGQLSAAGTGGASPISDLGLAGIFRRVRLCPAPSADNLIATWWLPGAPRASGSGGEGR